MDDQRDDEDDIMHILHSAVDTYISTRTKNGDQIPKEEILTALHTLAMVCARYWGMEISEIENMWKYNLESFSKVEHQIMPKDYVN
jgi:hypothetical protein